VVTDPGLLEAGWPAELLGQLRAAGLHPVVWNDVTPNPKDHEIEAGHERYREAGCDVVLGIGGGSVIDAAKGVALLAANSGRIVDADEALGLGIVERVLSAEDVLATAIADARRLANGPRQALAAAKAAIAAAVTSPGAPGIQVEREAFLSLFGTPDQREGMAAFLEKREPRFGG